MRGFGKPDKSGPNYPAVPGRLVIRLIKAAKGERYRSPLIQKLMFYIHRLRIFGSHESFTAGFQKCLVPVNSKGNAHFAHQRRCRPSWCIWQRDPDRLQKNVKQNPDHVTMKLYPNCRHELLNETEKELVYQDILSWLLAASEKPSV